MNRVAIVGAGITDCRGRWVEATYWDLFQQATRRTLEDAKMQRFSLVEMKEADVAAVEAAR